MNKIKQSLVISALLVPSIAFAASVDGFTTTLGNVKAAIGPQQAEVTAKGDTLTIVSPRTGISYTLNQTAGRSIILQTDAIAAANNVTAKTLMAQNPAVSQASQLNVEKELIELSAQRTQ